MIQWAYLQDITQRHWLIYDTNTVGTEKKQEEEEATLKIGLKRVRRRQRSGC